MRGHRRNRSRPSGAWAEGPHLPWPSSPRHLGRQVLRGPTEGFHGGPVTDALLAQAEVGDLDVAVLVQHEVFQLQDKSACQRHSVYLRVSCRPRNPTRPCPSLGWGVGAGGRDGRARVLGGGVREQPAPPPGVRPSEAWGEEADPAPPQPLQPPGSWEDRAGGDGSQVLPEWLPQLWAVVVTLQACGTLNAIFLFFPERNMNGHFSGPLCNLHQVKNTTSSKCPAALLATTSSNRKGTSFLRFSSVFPTYEYTVSDTDSSQLFWRPLSLSP